MDPELRPVDPESALSALLPKGWSCQISSSAGGWVAYARGRFGGASGHGATRREAVWNLVEELAQESLRRAAVQMGLDVDETRYAEIPYWRASSANQTVAVTLSREGSKQFDEAAIRSAEPNIAVVVVTLEEVVRQGPQEALDRHILRSDM